MSTESSPKSPRPIRARNTTRVLHASNSSSSHNEAEHDIKGKIKYFGILVSMIGQGDTSSEKLSSNLAKPTFEVHPNISRRKKGRVDAGKVSPIVNRLSKDLTKQSGAMADVNLCAKPTGQKVVVRYSYSGSREDELDLKEGDEIEVMETVEDGWIRGRLNGRVGVFPTNFVSFSESVAPPAPTATPAGDRSYSTKLEESELTSFVEGGGVRAKSSIFGASDLTTPVRRRTSVQNSVQLPATPTPTLRENLIPLIEESQIGNSFELALKADDLAMLMSVCNKVDPDKYLGKENSPLPVESLLSLLTQLSSELISDTDLKLRYVEYATMFMQRHQNEVAMDPAKQEILENVRNTFSEFIDKPASMGVHRRIVRLLLELISNLLN